ncbi:MAG TPA: winged helix-turn-helix transcriptional regulator [Nitrososphaeraceae archaeon]|nr:winged helix-turn-helix transcriptional regulator [Nitrososphaeraceae archaeon]
MLKGSDSNYLNSKSNLENRSLEEKCGILNIWDVLGRRWSLLILKNLSSKNVVRFNELKRSLKDISNTVLSDTNLSCLSLFQIIIPSILLKLFLFINSRLYMI